MSRTPGLPDPLSVRGLTVRYGKVAALRDVSFSVPRGAVYVLLGRKGAGKTSLVRCLLGALKPSDGKALLFGRTGWWWRRRALARVGVVRAEPGAPPGPVPASASRPEALVLDEPVPGLSADARRAILEELAADAAAHGTAILVTARDAAGVEGLATRVGVLREGRLVLDADPEALARRFRRIRYRNEITEDRTAYGTELDAFDAVRVKVRGWGIEAVVSNFGEEAFSAFASLDGVAEARVETLSLAEIFAAVAGEGAPPGAARDTGTATP